MLKLIGIPFDANSSFLRGPSYAPARIRLVDHEGSANAYSENGTEIKAGKTYQDLGDVHFTLTNPEAAYQTIYNKIKNLLTDGSKILSLGGDHSISYPVIKAHAEMHPGLNVLQFDAHGDLYDNFDDNPYSHASPFARLMETGLLRSLTQVGVRALTPHQTEQAERFGVNIIEMKDFNTDDFLKGILKSLTGPLYISLDLDVLDPAFAPGISHHEPGGMDTRTLINILQKINVNVVGADIVEYNPVRDVHNMTAMVAYKMMKEIMAKLL
jgi:agmatinase